MKLTKCWSASSIRYALCAPNFVFVPVSVSSMKQAKPHTSELGSTAFSHWAPCPIWSPRLPLYLFLLLARCLYG